MSRHSKYSALISLFLTEVVAPAVEEILTAPKKAPEPKPEPAPAKPEAPKPEPACSEPPAHKPARAWAFAVDLLEADNVYVLAAELPGFAKDGVHVRIDSSANGSSVSISAERPSVSSLPPEAGLRRVFSEIPRESLSRSIALSGEVDSERSSAKLENGVLTLTLPKKAPTAKGVEISIG